MSGGEIRLSHSRKGVMQSCGRKYRYIYEEQLAPVEQSANLVFGKAIHAAVSALLTAQAFGVPLNASEVFEAEWAQVATQKISYSALWDEDKMSATGHRLIELFQEDWEQRGWRPVMDPNGLPLIERTLKVRLPGGILFTAIIDAVVKTADGRVVVLDFKTPSGADPEGFSELSDQLTAYQVAVEANKDELGIKKVDGLAFYHMVKRPMPKTNRGKGPQIESVVVAPRDQEAIAEWIKECQFVADDIRRKRYFRRPMDSWNSPCGVCDFRKKCLGLPTDGMFVKREYGKRESPKQSQLLETLETPVTA